MLAHGLDLRIDYLGPTPGWWLNPAVLAVGLVLLLALLVLLHWVNSEG